MKHLLIKAVLVFLVPVALFSCKEDPYAEWKILNENKYAEELVRISNDSSYKVSSSGLCYKIIYPGNMKKPNKNSYVVVEYSGTLITGEVFDSGTYKYYLSSAVAGWQEAITKIRVGGRMKIFFPHTLGYGEDGSGTIPPYSMLYFDIELLEASY